MHSIPVDSIDGLASPWRACLLRALRLGIERAFGWGVSRPGARVSAFIQGTARQGLDALPRNPYPRPPAPAPQSPHTHTGRESSSIRVAWLPGGLLARLLRRLDPPLHRPLQRLSPHPRLTHASLPAPTPTPHTDLKPPQTPTPTIQACRSARPPPSRSRPPSPSPRRRVRCLAS